MVARIFILYLAVTSTHAAELSQENAQHTTGTLSFLSTTTYDPKQSKTTVMCSPAAAIFYKDPTYDSFWATQQNGRERSTLKVLVSKTISWDTGPKTFASISYISYTDEAEGVMPPSKPKHQAHVILINGLMQSSSQKAIFISDKPNVDVAEILSAPCDIEGAHQLFPVQGHVLPAGENLSRMDLVEEFESKSESTTTPHIVLPITDTFKLTIVPNTTRLNKVSFVGPHSEQTIDLTQVFPYLKGMHEPALHCPTKQTPQTAHEQKIGFCDKDRMTTMAIEEEEDTCNLLIELSKRSPGKVGFDVYASTFAHALTQTTWLLKRVILAEYIYTSTTLEGDKKSTTTTLLVEGVTSDTPNHYTVIATCKGQSCIIDSFYSEKTPTSFAGAKLSYTKDALHTPTNNYAVLFIKLPHTTISISSNLGTTITKLPNNEQPLTPLGNALISYDTFTGGLPLLLQQGPNL